MGGLRGTTKQDRFMEKDPFKFKFSMNCLDVNVFK